MTDKGSDGMVTKQVILRGFPGFIFCSAKDESGWDVWDEVKTRFMFVSPNMIPIKYREGNKLIGKTFGLPKTAQHNKVISPEEVQIARRCFLTLKNQIMKLCNGDPYSNPVWVPYHSQLTDMLPSSKGSDNRVTARLFSMINMVALAKGQLRSKIVFNETGEQCVIATFQDLREALHLIQNITGLPPHKLRFYKDIIWRLYKERNDDKLTSTDITDFYNRRMPEDSKKFTTDNITKTYLEELHNHNYLEKKEDEDSKKKHYFYYPIVAVEDEELEVLDEEYKSQNGCSNLSNPDQFDKKLHFSRLLLPKNHPGFPQNWLLMQILEDFSCRIDNPNFTICDIGQKEISLQSFVESYETDDLNLAAFYKKWGVNSTRTTIEILQLLTLKAGQKM
jgi:hypothetical protein